MLDMSVACGTFFKYPEMEVDLSVLGGLATCSTSQWKVEKLTDKNNQILSPTILYAA
jgi:hypothetical protein